MKIEVSCRKSDSTKEKGDLLESLACDLLSAQNYSVIKEIRLTGAELDLLCKNNINGKEIYVECKAQSGNISAPILRQLAGTVDSYEYAEGWIFSTADFGKEAKGFIEMWKKKPIEKSSKLSFYSPDDIVISLQKSSIISEPPFTKAESFIGSSDLVGEWSLLISPFGRFWAVYTLKGGVPNGVLFYHAKSQNIVSDKETIANISTLDSVFCDYEIEIGLNNYNDKESDNDIALPNVVEVQTGDSWDDYRPARPQDFIGRDDVQKSILSFLEKARVDYDATRIFAITGNSGLGKSSLIAKVRDRTKNVHYRKKLFTIAIDMRGARNPAYVSASLVKCLEQAQKFGFGKKVEIKLTNPTTPLSSDSIVEYLRSVSDKNQFICLIFDQFEELYSKPDLFSVFTAAKDLMMDVASVKGSFGLGFAWKTDSTTQQDHPAYHIWHELSDHRREFKLGSFNKGEVTKAITSFEKEFDLKLTPEIRHQISYSCQGFPWLLKKLCIHLHSNMDLNNDASSTILELDVKNLFESDLQTLNQKERSCLDLISKKSPADWSEIIEISGVSIVNALVNKRLIVRSGDRLNIYWDVFKDYLLLGNIPIVPFNYVPTSDITSMLKIAIVLEKEEYQSASDIALKANMKDRTVWNIGADLVLFGVAERQGTNFKLHRNISDGNANSVLSTIREKIDKHSVKILLYREHAGQTIGRNEVASVLKTCLHNEKFVDNTWVMYVNRFVNIFVRVGFLVRSGSKFTVQNSGSVVSRVSQRSRNNEVFPAMASPASVCEAWYLLNNDSNISNANSKGYRNSISLLKRFNLLDVEDDVVVLNVQAISKFGGINEAIWTLAKNEVVIGKCVDLMTKNPDVFGIDIGRYVSDEFDLGWKPASMARTGNALKQWAGWIIDGSNRSVIPEPPGRAKN